MLRRMPTAVIAGALCVILCASCFFGLLLGYLPMSPADVGAAILSKAAGGAGASVSGLSPADAVWDIRLPRVILSAGTGMGLALSGVVMQAIFRNPMADPYIMGVSSGAALGAACTVFLGIGAAFGAESIGLGAFAGALALSLAAAAAAGRMHEGNPAGLLIFGAALSAVCGGVTGVLIFTGANSTGMDVTLYWLMGSVSSAKLMPGCLLLSVVMTCFLFFLTQTRMLNLMLEGEETAVPLGRRLLPFVRLYLTINALLTGWIVMNAGLIGFVGLLVPHFTRMAVGADHRRLLPTATLLGGIAAVWADILGRTAVSGADIPLGVTLALVGAPIFIVMLVRRSYRFEGGNE